MKLLNITNKNRQIYLFCRNDVGEQVIIKDNEFFPFFYEIDQNGKFLTYDGVKVKKIFVPDPSDIPKLRTITSYSADILFTKNYLINKINKIDKTIIKYMFLDIEVVSPELPNIYDAKYPISCITIYNSEIKQYKTWYIENFQNKEDEMLIDFVKYIYREKPDLLLAWNMYNFDFPYIFNRYKNILNRNFSAEISPIQLSRYGENDIQYPSGISIMDYLGMFKKIFMREQSYALDKIAQKHLKEKAWIKEDFNKISVAMKDKNINDVRRMVKLEESYKIIPYFDELRRLSKSLWEDLYHNSFIIEMLLFEEAKNKNIILPNKPKNKTDNSFTGAIRDYSQTGDLYNIGKYDLTSAYPSMIIDFCLDSQNIVSNSNSNTIKINNILFEQNQGKLLPSLLKKLLKLKGSIKNELNNLIPDTEEYKKIQTKYDAIKSVVNSCFGVMGYSGFRIYDNNIAATITFLVRDLLNYVKEYIEKEGYKVIYYDTDSVFINSIENIKDKLNMLIKQWAKEKYNKEDLSVEFEYEGYFESIFILTKCRYYGILKTKKGIKEEIKGIEVNRASSSNFESEFQKTLLKKILNKETKEQIDSWIILEKQRIKTLPIKDIAFPCKIANRKYENNPIFIRAYKNTQKINPKFILNAGELYYYIFVNSPLEVLAFTEEENSHIANYNINWKELIRRNISSKVQNIYEAKNWDYKNNYNQLALL